MALVSVRINGRDYTLSCDDGQEEQLIALGQEVDDRIRQISAQAPHAGDVMLLLLACLMMGDELADTRRQLRQSNARVTRLEERLQAQADAGNSLQSNEHETENQLLAETLASLAKRIEAVAQTLEIS